jgi:L-threonylcarbamoyladenylate synthase
MSAQTHDSAAQLADRLGQGELVVLGTETVYGLAAAGTLPDACRRLADARAALAGGVAPVGPVAWHAGSVESVLAACPGLSARGQRLLGKLLPGPITIALEQPPAAHHETAQRLGLAPGGLGCQDASATFVRVPDQRLTGGVLRAAAEFTPLAIGIPDRSGRPVTTAEAAADRLAEVGVVASGVLDVGPTRLGRPSDRLRVRADGSWTLESPGIFDAGYIERLMTRTILFVCTGNTCRSPMAQAIAAGLQGTGSPAVSGLRFVSAGVAAHAGDRYSAETVEAVRRLGMAPPSGSSQPLTRELIARAEVIYAMTKRHREAVLAIDASAAGKLHLLDPDGRDIPDPIGQPQAQYDQVASAMRGILDRRRKEWDE